MIVTNMELTHPPDEVLTQCAMGRGGEDVRAHLEVCPSCSRHVKELRSIVGAIKSIPDEDIPKRVAEAIFKSAKSRTVGSPSWCMFSVGRFLKTPLVIGLGSILLLLFFYIFIVFVL